MITVWISFSRTTQVIPSFCGGCCFRKHLFTGKIPVFPLRMLRALPRSLLRGCLGVQIQRGQSSKMVLSDSRAFEALGFQTSLRCTTPTHSQRSLVSDLQQEASELVFSALFYDSSVNLEYGQTPWQDSCQLGSETDLLLSKYKLSPSLASPGGKSPRLRVSGLWHLSMSPNLQWCDVVDHLA